MSVSSFHKRFGTGVFLLFILTVSWLFYGTQSELATGRVLSRSNNTGARAAQNSAHRASTPPASPQLLAATRLPEQRLPQMSDTTVQLTAGLRPGRGDAIPDVQDVHDLPLVDISFYNWRGNLLSGWFALRASQAPVIILTHGTPGNRVSMIGRAAFLYNHGYNILLFDFQSYGRSQGLFSTLGMVESEDILSAINYVHSLPATTNSKIGILGLSMGATAAVLAAARTHDILALVADSCPEDATRVPGDVPDDEARDADRELVEDVYGVDITQARPIDVVQKLTNRTALFFINGDDDHQTPLPGMEELYKTAGNPKQSWIVPTADHAQSFALDPQEYSKRVSAFFDTYLAPL